MAKAKRDFATTLQCKADLNHVLDGIKEGYEDNLHTSFIGHAIEVGLAKHFSFVISDYRNQDDSGYTEEEALFAVIYPTKYDATRKCPNVIRAMLPGVIGTDECCETEWRFHMVIKDATPAKIAAFLTERGFIWDEKNQQNNDVIKEVKAALIKKAKAQKPPKA